MNLLLLFFLLGLFLQGVKALVKRLLTRSEDFDEEFLSRSTEMDYTNLLAFPITSKKHGGEVSPSERPFPAAANQGTVPKGKEVFMPTSFHQSA